MISLSGYLLFLVTFAVAAALPGPGVAALVARTLSHGPIAGFGVILGIICGDLVWLTVAILGLAALAQTFAMVFLAIKYLGAGYLFYLAWRLWRAPVQSLDLQDRNAKDRKFSSFWIGLSVTLSNPKAIMFYMAILPTLIDIGHAGSDLFILLVVTIATVLTVIFSGYILLAVGIKQFFRQSAAIRTLQRGTSLIMAGAAAMIATR